MLVIIDHILYIYLYIIIFYININIILYYILNKYLYVRSVYIITYVYIYIYVLVYLCWTFEKYLLLDAEKNTNKQISKVSSVLYIYMVIIHYGLCVCTYTYVNNIFRPFDYQYRRLPVYSHYTRNARWSDFVRVDRNEHTDLIIINKKVYAHRVRIYP